MSDQSKRNLAEVRILSKKHRWDFLRENKNFQKDVDALNLVQMMNYTRR